LEAKLVNVSISDYSSLLLVLLIILLNQIRSFWRWLNDNQADYAVLTGELMRMPIKWVVDDVLSAVRVLLQAGFHRARQLACVMGNAWSTNDPQALMVIHGAVEHMTVSLR
jgi:hypothetical protein